MKRLEVICVLLVVMVLFSSCSVMKTEELSTGWVPIYTVTGEELIEIPDGAEYKEFYVELYYGGYANGFVIPEPALNQGSKTIAQFASDLHHRFVVTYGDYLVQLKEYSFLNNSVIDDVRITVYGKK